MPIPDFQTLMLPLLEVLADEREQRMRDVTGALAGRFQLTPEEVNQLMPSGENKLFTNRVAWAKGASRKQFQGSRPRRIVLPCGRGARFQRAQRRRARWKRAPREG